MNLRNKLVSFAILFAFASPCGAAQPSPQGGIAAVSESNGQVVFINAVNDPPAVSSSLTSFRALQPSPEIRKLIGLTSRAHQVDPKLVDAVMRVESGYQADARSPKGALGLMQLIPATAARFGVQNPFDPAQNIRGGVEYLGELLKTFNGDVPLTLAAYNAGEGAVLHYDGIPPYQETQSYVRKVTALYPDPSTVESRRERSVARNVRAPAKTAATRAGRIAGFTGFATDRDAAANNSVSPVPIYRYVDSGGRIHFAQ
jgi:Transglycosylase SLT domain